MPAKRKRRGTIDYINLRLSPGRDDDLIELWRGLPAGQGGQTIKDAIRAGLKGELPARAARVSDLDTLAHWLAEQMAGQAERLEQRIAALETRIAAGGLQASPGPAGQPETGNGARRLSEGEAAALKAKIAGRGW